MKNTRKKISINEFFQFVYDNNLEKKIDFIDTNFHNIDIVKNILMNIEELEEFIKKFELILKENNIPYKIRESLQRSRETFIYLRIENDCVLLEYNSFENHKNSFLTKEKMLKKEINKTVLNLIKNYFERETK